LSHVVDSDPESRRLVNDIFGMPNLSLRVDPEDGLLPAS